MWVLYGRQHKWKFQAVIPEVVIYFKATENDKKDYDIQLARLLILLIHDRLKFYNTIKNDKEETV